MIYEEPRYRMLGDRYLSVEFADTIHLSENFRIQAITRRLNEQPLDGVVEVVPHLRNLAVIFDSVRTGIDRVRDYVAEAVAEVEVPRHVDSRLFRIPVWYDDPWSRAMAEKYGVENNLAFVAAANGIAPEEAIARHTGTDFWIAAVGFVPGCYWAIPLDFGMALSAPKYRVPRDFTPARAVALAGLSTTIYPYPGPGGYQCIGRAAIETYDLSGGNPLFPDDGVLACPGDRHRHYAVDPLAYDDIRERIRHGRYEYEVRVETVDLESYRTDRDD